MTKTIVAKIDAKGNVFIETKGFKGKACAETVEKILANMKANGVDAKTGKIDYTPDYYQDVREHSSVRSG